MYIPRFHAKVHLFLSIHHGDPRGKNPSVPPKKPGPSKAQKSRLVPKYPPVPASHRNLHQDWTRPDGRDPHVSMDGKIQAWNHGFWPKKCETFLKKSPFNWFCEERGKFVKNNSKAAALSDSMIVIKRLIYIYNIIYIYIYVITIYKE